jgi:uncharacterized surface protein with fasciclin (FAS1) repeats
MKMISKQLTGKTGSKLNKQFGASLAVMLMVFTVTAAEAKNKVSDVLANNGFGTLLFALDATELTAVLDENRVTLFAPTDDVFDATAVLLGCGDALTLATALLNIPVGDNSNALAAVLSYHAYLGRLKGYNDILFAGEIQMVSGDTVTTGVDQNGTYVKGTINETASSITARFNSNKKGSKVYAIDQILLPIDPTGICDS